jgi:very-short-patch-repair endonuclease
MHLPRNEQLRQNGRNLRKEATREENHLWFDFLRTHALQFHRQRIIGSYIVDFYCPAVKLAVEIDGSQHFEEDGMAYDRNRTIYLNSLGVTVIRFSNRDIQADFEGVCAAIDLQIKELR